MLIVMSVLAAVMVGVAGVFVVRAVLRWRGTRLSAARRRARPRRWTSTCARRS